MKVLIVLKHRFPLWTAPDWFVEKLRAEFPDITFVNHRSYDNIENDLRDADVIIGWSLKGEQIEAAPKLRWIHSTAAAIHLLMIPEIIDSDIIVTNARSVHGPVVAEHVMALMLAMAKRLPSAMRMQREHLWGQERMTEEQPPIRELRGSTVGLVGVGSIGGEVGRIASAMGMRIIAVRANPAHGVDWLPKDDPARDRHTVLGPDGLEHLLEESDFVVLSAPVTEKTTHMIGATELCRMKSDAYLINVGRGVLIGEQALAETLKQRKIGGAALDVFEHEPLAPESPLWDLDNVLITPHTAGISQKSWERHFELFSENLRRYLRGEQLIGLVNKKAGY